MPSATPQPLRGKTNEKNILQNFSALFWLVFGGCGSAVLAAAYPELGIGFAGVALAFGLTVLTMAYAVGHISGGHFNPAVSVGLFIGGRFNGKDLLPYIVSQVIGAIAAAGVLYLIASGKTGFDAVASGFASNGFGEHSPNGYDMMAALLIEFVLTAFFLIIIMGSTDKIGSGRLRSYRHRPGFDPDSLDQHSCNQYFC